MTQRWMTGTVLGFALVLASCEKPALPPPDMREADAKAIRDLEEEWAKAGAAKDAVKFSSFYAADAAVYVSGAPAMRGTEAITNGMKQVFGDPNFALAFKTGRVHAAKSGDLACSEGTYDQTATNPANKKKVAEHGNYVTCYMKQADGSWKVIADITSAEPPAPMTKHAK